MLKSSRNRLVVALLMVMTPVGAIEAASVGSAQADGATVPVLHPTLFAPAPSDPYSSSAAKASKPDDITKLGGVLYVTYQNHAGADGAPVGSYSTIVGFDSTSGQVVSTWKLIGRCDGLTADPSNDRLLASVNEDLNSSLYVITPGNPTPAHYTYSPSPAESGTAAGGSAEANGGTDSISVAPDGTVYVAHSNPEVGLPAPDNTAAVYTVMLSGATANLTRLFGINDSAGVINPGASTPNPSPLALTDPDSNRYFPGHDGGTLIQDAQADSKLVFASDLNDAHPTLRQLNLTNATGPASTTPQLDDIERITGKGTLFVADQGSGSIYSITTDNAAHGTWVVSQPAPSGSDLPNTPALGLLNPKTGVVTQAVTTFVSPKGLLFVAAAKGESHDQDHNRGDQGSEGHSATGHSADLRR